MWWHNHVPAGEIVPDFGQMKGNWKFLMNSHDEIQFLVAHGTMPKDVLAIGAGTLRRAKIVREADFNPG